MKFCYSAYVAYGVALGSALKKIPKTFFSAKGSKSRV